MTAELERKEETLSVDLFPPGSDRDNIGSISLTMRQLKIKEVVMED